MVEMAASASASLAARSLAAILPGAGSWRNETFGARRLRSTRWTCRRVRWRATWSARPPRFLPPLYEASKQSLPSSHENVVGTTVGQQG